MDLSHQNTIPLPLFIQGHNRNSFRNSIRSILLKTRFIPLVRKARRDMSRCQKWRDSINPDAV